MLKAYSSYTTFSHTLLYTLFRTWVQQITSEVKPYLALPTQAEAQAFMAEVKKKPGGKGASSMKDLGGASEMRQNLFNP